MERLSRLIAGSKGHALVLMPASILPGACALIGMVWVNHHGGLASVGMISLARVAATFGAAILANGPALAALRLMTGGDQTRTSELRGAMLLKTAYWVPILVGAGVGVSLIDASIGRALIWSAPLLVVETLYNYEADLFRYEGKFSRSSALTSSRALLAWLSVAIVVTMSNRFDVVMAVMVVVLGLVTWGFRMPRVSRLSAVARAQLRKTWTPITWLNVAGYALNNGDQYVIAAIAGPAAVGVYSLGYQLGGGAISTVAEPVGSAVQPRIVYEWHDPVLGPTAARATARKAALVVLVAGIAITGAISLAGLAGWLHIVDASRSLVFVAATVAAATAMHVAASLRYSGELFARDHAQAMARCSWLTLGFSALSLPLLTKWQGVQGAAVATLLGYGFLALLLAREVSRLPARDRAAESSPKSNDEAALQAP